VSLVALDTVTVTPADVAVFPAVSRAVAVNTCAPLGTLAEFDESE
jgi:hypothetical protein